MTILSVKTIAQSRKFPTPPADGSQPPQPQVYPAPDYPFRGYRAPDSEGYQQSAANPSENAIVIDNGANQVKAGFSFDKSPRYLFSPIMARYRDRKLNKPCCFIGNDAYVDATTRGQIRTAFEPGTSIVSNWDVMEGILDYTFIKLGVDGAEGSIGRPVVMTEPVANLGYTRRMMNEILFECYSAPSVTYGIDSLFSYRYNNGTDGLIISSSHTATHVIPVLNSKPVLLSSARLNWGGYHAQDYLMKLIKLKYPTFPGKITEQQMEEYVKNYCHMSLDYGRDLSTYLDWSGLEARNIVIQYPFTEHVVAEKSAEELARIAERKKESGRRLQEQAAKMRLEKLMKKEQEFEYFKQLQITLQSATKKEQKRLLDAEELKDEVQLERLLRDLDKSIRRSRNKDVGNEEEEVEEQSFPLLDLPDDQLDEAGIKEKRHQRLMKSGVEARQRAKAEKERERARIAEEQRLDDEKRENNFDDWIAERHAAREELLARIKEQQRLKQDAGGRKSLASQMRMKTLANLASDGPKKRRRGGGEYDDDFGANDDDWGVYRTVATEPASDDEEEEDPNDALKAVEAQLLKYDPTFTEQHTLEAQSDWTKSLIHAFLRGPRPFDPESQREAHQIHLNVERIRVPEIVFQPSIAGIDQAGLSEIVADVVLQRFRDPSDQSRLLKDIFLAGGNTLFKGFDERLSEELRAVLPIDVQLNLRSAKDPILDAWRGAASWWSGSNLQERQNATVSRAEYLEKGSEYLKEHSLGNSAGPQLPTL
ncbi:putative chromatin remodeling complex subunit [Phaeomoniella chlamydospora]|uniref:Putative chromatin remodeling complex subunit n=1 Tax=Phaeomoniella chlamydospora TaxID=158046 RepID=A0A0G2EVN9_PHACM|nr:putative chromatin remodeling complex subunit [Phaeomoniella chlamydospora]